MSKQPYYPTQSLIPGTKARNAASNPRQHLEVKVDTKDNLVQEAILRKECRRCKKVKPYSDFHVDRGAKTGHVPVCKECSSELGKLKALEAKAAQKPATVEPVQSSIPPLTPDPVQASVVFEVPFTAVMGPAKEFTAKWPSKTDVQEGVLTAIPQRIQEDIDNIKLKNRRDEVVAAVAMLLAMPEADSASVIAMVQAYRGAQKYHAQPEGD